MKMTQRRYLPLSPDSNTPTTIPESTVTTIPRKRWNSSPGIIFPPLLKNPPPPNKTTVESAAAEENDTPNCQRDIEQFVVDECEASEPFSSSVSIQL